MRVLQRLRQLAQQIQARREIEAVGASTFEEAVQALGVGVVLEDQGRALLRVGERLHAQDAVVGDAVEQLVLPLRRATPLRTHSLGRSPREGVDAHPPLRSGH